MNYIIGVMRRALRKTVINTIKREWKNGRWVYYYDAKYITRVRKKGKRTYSVNWNGIKKDIGIDALKTYKKARSNLETANKNKVAAGRKAAQSAKYLSQTKNPTRWSNRPVTLHKKNMAAFSKSITEYNNAKSQVDKALNELRDTPIGRLI